VTPSQQTRVHASLNRTATMGMEVTTEGGNGSDHRQRGFDRGSINRVASRIKLINNSVMRRFTIAALGLFLACTTSCVVVTDECNDGELLCDGDIIEECIHGEWHFLEDCFDLCGGVCDFEHGDPVCLC
jgi:hypothetical protein